MSSIPIEYSKFKDKESVSVGEFIGVFSEAVTFTANQKEKNVSNLKNVSNFETISILLIFLFIQHRSIKAHTFLNFVGNTIMPSEPINRNLLNEMQ